MDKKQVFDRIRKLPQTGTQAYGNANSSSDDDRYCSLVEYTSISKDCFDAGIPTPHSGYCNAFTAYDMKTLTRYNILCIPEKHHPAMKAATDLLAGVVKDWPLGEKWLSKKKNRYMLFRAVMAILENVTG